MHRRQFILAAVASGAWACAPRLADIDGGYVHEHHSAGHRLQGGARQLTDIAPSRQVHCHTAIVGAGVSGLSAAHHVLVAGQHDVHVFELGEQAGGNAQGGVLHGIAHPLGAHYLPVPDAQAQELLALLEGLGVARYHGHAWAFDERVLCHSPQERLFFNGAWQEGLLPVQGVAATTLAQYQRFHQLIEQWRATGAFVIAPRVKPRHANVAAVQTLRTVSFAQFLRHHGLNDAQLLWYLDYCCRDDYGAGVSTVSAWAGVHYFAARHGFSPPGAQAERAGVLTWPQGNGYLTQAMASPLAARLHKHSLVVQVEVHKHSVAVDVLDTSTEHVTRYHAQHCVLAVPVFVAARILVNPPAALRHAAQHIEHASWTVSNVYLDQPVRDGWGQAPDMAWDNVVYGSPSLGYVNATHQSTAQGTHPTVLTHYMAHGVGLSARRAVMSTPWHTVKDRVLAELAQVHPDIQTHAKTVNVTRYGHAMACPVVGHTVLTAPHTNRIVYAHSDWAGYSVFEEAFMQGVQAARRVQRG